MPEQTRPSLLSVRNLTVAFGKDNVSSPVVKGLDLDVKKGETVAIVGESGSGKSVTLFLDKINPIGMSCLLVPAG